ncbi:C40 family peptidase [Streptomyces sp. A7024]|uniref:C40 family peptidase n=1 Tax=Streptomyces coryli TaxID=1128680 RepID=A0A6G4TUR3_9ACTN|nr:C40 family peptidase [Streptomyces coryli]NGN63186.1 C40 family peptidase [Streptomyces coryli]
MTTAEKPPWRRWARRGLWSTPPLFILAIVLIAIAGYLADVREQMARRQNAACTTGAGDAALAAQVQQLLAGGDNAKGVRVEGLTEPSKQIPSARTIVATGAAMKVPARGQVVALATAMQESRLINNPGGDRDSIGLFQQRPSMGWGTAAQVHDPVYASKKFYSRLLKVDGWQQMPVTDAAQKVQKSGYPDAYAKWEPLAVALQQALAPTLGNGGTAGAGSTVPAWAAGTGAGSGCAEQAGDGGDLGPLPQGGGLPKGYQVPATVPPAVQKAIRWALQQLGTPYQWGGDCTNPHGKVAARRCDCSSLMQVAYRDAGIRITRVTYDQMNDGRGVAISQLKPGDLIFTEGGSHVGMAIGSGLVVHAHKPGSTVKINKVADWKPRTVAVRRIVG